MVQPIMSGDGSGDSPDATILLDRIVSASAASDVSTNLEALLDALAARQLQPSDVMEAAKGGSSLDDVSILQCFLQLLQGKHNNNLVVDDGPTLLVRLYQALCRDANACRTLLTEPSPGRCLEGLIEVAAGGQADDDDGVAPPSNYARVLALQTLADCHRLHSKLAQAQLLQAPNGLHRLADLLRADAPPEVRNAMLQTARGLAQGPAIAQVWIFADVGDVVVQLARHEGGLTDGNIVVLDCLKLLQQLLRHNASWAQLVLESPILVPALCPLLDLTQAAQFRNPSSHLVVVNDDLDDLLAAPSASEASQAKPTSVPKLLVAEEDILQAVLDVLEILLASEAVRPKFHTQHQPVVDLVWELALLVPPSNGTDYVCGIPSAGLVARALDVLATSLAMESSSDNATADGHSPPNAAAQALQRHNGLDRLLYIMCTGGLAAGSSREDQRQLAFGARQVLEQNLPAEILQNELIQTLAPVPSTEDNMPPPESVVQKLLHTIFENLTAPDNSLRTQFLVGALAGLELFVTTPANRSVLLRLQHPSKPELGLLAAIGQALPQEADELVRTSLWRFLAIWLQETDTVIHQFLTLEPSPLTGDNTKTSSSWVLLVAGLCLDGLTDEAACGGWTKAVLLKVLTGPADWTRRLEELDHSQAAAAVPWSACELERKAFARWHRAQVLKIRKRVVQLVASGTSEGGNDEAQGATAAQHAQLQSLVADQASKLEALRSQLDEAQQTVATQKDQIQVWERRVESNPTQLDGMLNEFTEKTAALEAQIRQLETEREQRAKEHEERLVQSRAETEQVQQERDAQTQAQKDAAQERDNLQAELASLSQTYTSLEEEYRRQQEQQQQQQQQQATDSEGNQITTLRADNDRLHQEAKAADEWMAMAVERMNGMTAQITQLEEQSQTANSEQQASWEATHQQWQERLQQLEAQLQTAVADQQEALQQSNSLTMENANLHQQLASERSQGDQSQQESTERCRQLEEQVTQLEATKTSLEGELQEAKSGNAAAVAASNEGLLQQEVATLTRSLEEATAARTQLEQRIQQLETAPPVATTPTNAVDLFDSAPPAAQPSNTDHSEEVDRLRAEIETLKSHEQQQVFRLESTIRELESRVGGDLGEYSVEDIRHRDAEIEQLRAANDEAQEWMSRAVEHDRVLTEQVATLTAESTQLRTEVGTLRTALNDSTNSVVPPENDSASGSQDIEQRDATIASLEARVDDLTKQVSEMETMRDSLDNSERERFRQEQAIRQLRETPEEFSALQARIDELSEALGAKDRLLQERESRLQELESQHLSETGTTESHPTGDRVAQLESQITELQLQLSSQAEEARAVITQWQESYEALQADHGQSSTGNSTAELESLRARVVELESGGDRGEEVKDLEEKLATQAEEARSVISQWQESYEALQLENERLGGASNTQDFDQLRERVNELEESQETMYELEEKLKLQQTQLETQESEAKDIISQWQERYSELERGISEKTDEINPEIERLQTRVKELEGLSTAANRVVELESQLGEARSTLESQKADAMDIISQWQERYTQLEQQLDAVAVDQGKIDQPSEEANRAEELATQLAEARTLIESQKSEALDTISQWQERYSELEKQLDAARMEQPSEEATRAEELETQLAEARDLLESQKADSVDTISQWQERYSALEKQLDAARLEQPPEDATRAEELETQLAKARDLLERQKADSVDTISQWQERYSELEQQLDAARLEEPPEDATRAEELETQLAEARDLLERQKADSVDAISQWQERYSELEQQLDAFKTEQDASEHQKDLQEKIGGLETTLENERLTAREIVSSWEERLSEVEAQVAEKDSRIAALEDETRELLSTMDERETEARSTIAEWQTSYEQLQSELSGAAVSESNPELSELRETVSALQVQLAEQEQEARDAVEDWATSYAELEARGASTSREVDGSTVDVDGQVAQLEATVASLNQQLEEQAADAEAAIDQWQERCTALEIQVGELHRSPANSDQPEQLRTLETRLEQQQEEASAAVAEWQTSYNELEIRLDETTQGLQRQLEEQEMKAQTVVSELQRRNAELESDQERVDALQSRLQELESRSDDSKRVEELEEKLASKQTEIDGIVKEWEGKVEDAKLHALSEANSVSQDQSARIDYLLEELQEAKDTSESFSTENSELQRECERLRELHQEEKQRAVHDIEKLNGEMQQKQVQMLSLEAENTELRDLNQSAQAAEDRCTQLQKELESANELLASQEETGSRSLDKVKENESTIIRLETELEKSSKLASDLSIRVAEKTAEVVRLASTLEAATSGDSDEMRELKSHLADQRKRADELEAQTKSLTELLNEQQVDAESALAEWEAHCSELGEDLGGKEQQLAGIGAELEKAQSQLEGLHSKLSSERLERQNIESELKEVKHQLHSHDLTALDDSRLRAEEIADLKTKMAVQQELLADSQQKAAVAKQQLSMFTVESEEIVGQWKDRAEELEGVVEELERKMEMQESEAVDAIHSWEARCTVLEKNVELLDTALEASQSEVEVLDSDLMVELSESRNALAESQSRIKDLEEKLAESQVALLSSLDSAKSEHERAEQSDNVERLCHQQQLEKLQSSYNSMTLDKEKRGEECNRLRVRVAELEDEIREANDALQLHITNHVIGKATETAADALRLEVDDLRNAMECERDALNAERECRSKFESEANRLRADLAALLGMDDSDDTHSEIQRQTLEATANYQRQERSEIVQLRQALSRVLGELEASKQAEKEASEAASKFELQVASYEQEIFSVKADLKFMNESMDDRREAESSRRSALENRISSLESEKSVTRRAYLAETENLQNEMSQLNMERDRLFQALKESERARESLLQASSRSSTTTDLTLNTPEAEVARLRLEKAQLLSAATEERARAEKRLREVRAAATSSANADKLVETELRHATEAELANAKSELEAMRSIQARQAPQENEIITELRETTQRDKKVIDHLNEQNSQLAKKLEDVELISTAEINKISEECREARLRASHLEQKSHFEAQVRAEVARLQAFDENIPYSGNGENPAESDDEETRSLKSQDSIIQTTQLYDVIRQQKQAIEDERNVYFELLAEHDDLLALLAQQDLSRTALGEALTRAAGKPAVDEAMKKAEEQALAQYGKFVKLNG